MSFRLFVKTNPKFSRRKNECLAVHNWLLSVSSEIRQELCRCEPCPVSGHHGLARGRPRGYCSYTYRNAVGVLSVVTVGGDPDPRNDNVVGATARCPAK